MIQPYTLRLERSSSGGSSGGSATYDGPSSSTTSLSSNNGKSQIAVHTTIAHHLASRLLLQKQPSLDDKRTTYVNHYLFCNYYVKT